MDTKIANQNEVPSLEEVETTPWIEKMIDDYHSKGTVDIDGLVRLLGEPTGEVSFADPTAAIKSALGIK